MPSFVYPGAVPASSELEERRRGAGIDSQNSVALIFTIQTYVSYSRPTSSIAREMPLWPFPSLLLLAGCFSPQLGLVLSVLPCDNVLLQRLRARTGDHSSPSAAEQRATPVWEVTWTRAADCHLTQPCAERSQADPLPSASDIAPADQQAGNT